MHRLSLYVLTDTRSENIGEYRIFLKIHIMGIKNKFLHKKWLGKEAKLFNLFTYSVYLWTEVGLIWSTVVLEKRAVLCFAVQERCARVVFFYLQVLNAFCCFYLGFHPVGKSNEQTMPNHYGHHQRPKCCPHRTNAACLSAYILTKIPKFFSLWIILPYNSIHLS